MIKKGLVYIFEGDGKGKTSAALGVALRMLLNNKKVFWVSWFKSESWHISEGDLVKYFPSYLEMIFAGEGFYLKNVKEKNDGVDTTKTVKAKSATIYDFNTLEVHKIAAQKALCYVKSRLIDHNPPELIVMDEVIRAIGDGLLTETEILEVISKRGKTHLVLTGHRTSKILAMEADLITSMKKIKHPYDIGVLAVKGLDY